MHFKVCSLYCHHCGLKASQLQGQGTELIYSVWYCKFNNFKNLASRPLCHRWKDAWLVVKYDEQKGLIQENIVVGSTGTEILYHRVIFALNRQLCAGYH